MKKFTLFLLTSGAYVTQLYAIKTVYIPRSQGDTVSMVCLPTYERFVASSLDYTRSRKSNHITQDLFGTCQLHFAGSQVAQRSSTALIADYFGCAPDFESTLSFNPSIQNVIFSLYYNMPLDHLVSGLYVNFFFPVVYTRWDLNPCETIINAGSDTYPAAYMGVDAATAQHSVRPYFAGNARFGDQQRALPYNKISWCPQSRTELAEILVKCGRNLLRKDNAFLSVYGLVSFPTGNKQNPEFLFSPLCGNGKFFELGVGVQGQYTFTPDHSRYQATLLFDGSFEHLFGIQQLRTFDFKQGPLTRYLLLKQIDTTTLAYDEQLIAGTFATTYPVQVSRPIQGQLALKLEGSCCGFTQAVGYSLWGTTAEHICPQFNQPTCVTSSNKFGIKGTTGAYYYTTGGGVTTGEEPLNATESSSTITRAGAIDTPQTIPDSTTWDNVVGGVIIDPSISAIQSSIPYIVGSGLIDVESGRSPAQLTQSFFAELGYQWQHHHARPHVLVGGFIETAGHHIVALAQWGVWIKGTISF